MVKRLGIFVMCFCLTFMMQAGWVCLATASPGDAPEATADVAPEGVEPTEAVDDAGTPLLSVGSRGDEVIMLQLRLRDLGYFNYKITDYFGSLTKSAVMAFQKENDLTQDGIVGGETAEVLFGNDAVRKPVKTISLPTRQEGVTVPVGRMADWFKEVLPNFSRGEQVMVIDVYTGISYKMQRVGGSLHADVEPVTKEDCANVLKSYGGTWSWDRRPVVVYLEGEWLAGSINGMPHGYETVPNNNMDGQICIHFYNSRTHIRNLADANHQRCVRIAAGKN